MSMGTGPRDYLAEDGQWNAVCFECGRKRKSAELKKHWKGYWVCPEHWETRQPQDFVRGVPDQQAPPWTQPMPADTFSQVCFPNGRSCIAGFGVAGCMVAGLANPPGFDPDVTA